MSDPPPAAPETGGQNPEEQLSMLFAQMVIQQSNMAMMLLGKAPHPQSGKTVQDLDAARMFIDQLEMIEAKTKGNLSKEEQTLLKQSLMSLRLAFVESVDAPASAQPESTAATESKRDAAPSTASTTATEPAPESSGPEAESKKKFSKRY
jgi:hypothetical protein